MQRPGNGIQKALICVWCEVHYDGRFRRKRSHHLDIQHYFSIRAVGSGGVIGPTINPHGL